MTEQLIEIIKVKDNALNDILTTLMAADLPINTVRRFTDIISTHSKEMERVRERYRKPNTGLPEQEGNLCVQDQDDGDVRSIDWQVQEARKVFTERNERHTRGATLRKVFSD